MKQSAKFASGQFESRSGVFSTRPKKDQRRDKRIVSARELPCSFCLGGQPYVALLSNVTLRGGGFTKPGIAEVPGLVAGVVLELSIQSDTGTVQGRKGRVLWTRWEEPQFYFGVEYVDLPSGAECLGVLNMDRIMSPAR